MPDLIYSFPKNLPTPSLRQYRFPYKGERSSARLNLCIHAIIGDLRVAYTSLSAIEQIDRSNMGCYLATTRQDHTLTS